MKARLQTNLSQQLAITPQLQQAIRLLQLPVSELAAELGEAVASNPLLEWAGEQGHDTPAPSSPPDQDGQGHEASATDGSDGHGEPLHDDRPWSGSSGGERDDSAADITERLGNGQDDLQAHLQAQMRLLPLNALDSAIATLLIDAIDADGYLRAPLEEIAAGLPPPHAVSERQVLTVLRLVQDMDPAGVGARDLGECLQLQLRQLPALTPGLELATQLAASHLSQLPRLGSEGLSRLLRRDRAEVQTAIDLLRSLDPRPGSRHARNEDSDHVLPDIIIWRGGGQWQARLGAHAGPPVTINQHYARLIGHCSDTDSGYLRSQLQQARWLIKGLQARGQTLLRVAQSLIRHQSGFLEFGEQALMPLTLREIAAELELHESTVSRAIAGKFVQTPRGTLAMRQFFSQAVVGDDGNEASGTAIQATIRRLIEAENPRKPLSDAKLVEQLQANGIKVARRTVAKYREAMSIPPSHERVRMG